MNVTFIGMSGAGKSHVGKRYADFKRMDFLDIDREMEKVFGKSVNDILLELGEETFLAYQTEQVLALGKIDNFVISPGGSVVYTPEAMCWLKENSTIVHLAVPKEVIEKRIDVASRGIVGLKERTFQELYDERRSLYEQWSDVTWSVPEGELDLYNLKI